MLVLDCTLFPPIYRGIENWGFESCSRLDFSGADQALVISGGPNSEHFLSDLRKLLKRGKLFLTTPSPIVKRN